MSDLMSDRLRGGLRPRAMSMLGGGFALLASVGCSGPASGGVSIDRSGLRRDALNSLKTAIRYPHNPVVRVEAVEALQSSGTPESLPWIRSALLDDHPAVRFAGCVAVGIIRDGLALGAVRGLLDDEDPSVRVAALFALHRSGDTERTGEIATYLLEHQDATVRRNAALVLGLMGEPGAIKVLARAMKDPDTGVRHHALEAMARLGNREAAQELAFLANTGVGSEEVFAINALAATGDRTFGETFRYKLATAAHLETRLAAARGLGSLKSDEGFALARRALARARPAVDDPNDSPAEQVLRIRLLAAAALGAIGRLEALPALEKTMKVPGDPRVQVSAAQAIVEILKADPGPSARFASEQSRQAP